MIISSNLDSLGTLQDLVNLEHSPSRASSILKIEMS